MITSIELQNVVTFTIEVVIDVLQRINVIYGDNSKGKSIISRALCDQYGRIPIAR